MVEEKLLLDELEMEYEGLFDATELFGLVDNWLKLKGYDKLVTLDQEQVVSDSKHVHVIWEPMKWHTDYVRKKIKFEVMMSDVKEVETVIDKAKIRINQGKVRMLFSGILHTDWEGRWEQKPIYHFLRVVFNKYVYSNYTKDYEGEIVGDVKELMGKVGSFLNLYRFKKSL